MRNSSAEGALRLHYGLGKGEIGNVGTKGIEFRIAESPEWMGARVVLRLNREGKTYIDLLPQVGARTEPTREWTWYLEKEVDAAFAAKYPKGSEFNIVGCGDDHERMEQRLLRVCPTFQKKGTRTPPIGEDGKVGIRLEAEFNSVVRRCLAKIAFNYMAWATNPEFALRPEFDVVRSFVRQGFEPTKEIVYFRRKPILAQEVIGRGKITDGHVLALEAMPEKHKVEVLLSLFNSMKYRIVLSDDYGGIWFAKGHHFDVHSKEVSELAAAPTFDVMR